jgi:hypothetical protein
MRTNVLTASLGQLAPVLLAMRPAGMQINSRLISFHPQKLIKHKHFCVAGQHHWTVFTTVPTCPHKGGDRVCPVNVSCPSHRVGEPRQ